MSRYLLACPRPRITHTNPGAVQPQRLRPPALRLLHAAVLRRAALRPKERKGLPTARTFIVKGQTGEACADLNYAATWNPTDNRLVKVDVNSTSPGFAELGDLHSAAIDNNAPKKQNTPASWSLSSGSPATADGDVRGHLSGQSFGTGMGECATDIKAEVDQAAIDAQYTSKPAVCSVKGRRGSARLEVTENVSNSGDSIEVHLKLDAAGKLKVITIAGIGAAGLGNQHPKYSGLPAKVTVGNTLTSTVTADAFSLFVGKTTVATNLGKCTVEADLASRRQ